MKRLLALFALCAMLPGCGGGGSSSGTPVINVPTGPFSTDRTGTWAGRQADTLAKQSGQMVLTIASDGAVTGTWQTDAGTVWAISGDTGGLDFDAPGQPHLTTYGNPSFVVSSQTGHLGGRATEQRPNPPNAIGIPMFSFAFDLTRQ